MSNTVELIPQDKSNACWLASSSMMETWKTGKHSSLTDTLKVLDASGKSFSQIYKVDGGLAFDDNKVIVSSLGLTALPPASYTIEYLTSILDQSPIMAVIMYSTNSNIAHMIVITGITGDGSPGGTSLQINDPLPLNSGTSYTISFNDFLTKFEQVVQFENKWPNSDLTSQFFYFKGGAKSSGDTSTKSSNGGSSSGDTSGKSSDGDNTSGDNTDKSSDASDNSSSDTSSSDDSGTSSDTSNSSSDTSSGDTGNSSSDTSGTDTGTSDSSSDTSGTGTGTSDSSSDTSGTDTGTSDTSSDTSGDTTGTSDSASSDTSTGDSGTATSSDSGDASSTSNESDTNQ